MAYVYRYIDMNKRECVYIGKVMGDADIYVNPLERRHEQHKRDDWYKEIGDENLLLQFTRVPTHADADILETYLISQYEDTGQLKNKAKVGWGKSCVVSTIIKWENYLPYDQLDSWICDKLHSVARIISKSFEFQSLNDAEKRSIDEVRNIFSTIKKSETIRNGFAMSDELYLRVLTN